jgi:hypothetical protein
VPIEDIYGMRWEIALGQGWHELESLGGTSFRWAMSNAECTVSTFRPGRQRVTFDLEPGPGVGDAECRLTIFDEHGDRRFDEPVLGRRFVPLTLDATGPTVHIIRLHVAGGGARDAADIRVLDFRVFGITLEAVPADVVAVASGCHVGAGWYPIEVWNGTRFRWVDNDARIVVERSGPCALELDLEPGPGTAGRPLELTVTGRDGARLGAFRLRGRERIAVPLPPEAERPFEVILHGEGGGEATPGDARVLNFRAFCECA